MFFVVERDSYNSFKIMGDVNGYENLEELEEAEEAGEDFTDCLLVEFVKFI